MNLPNGDRAIVPLPKLVGDLLSETHPVGRAKARFFRTLGFVEENSGALRQALLDIAREGEITNSEQSPYGMQYVVEGMLLTPRDERVRLRTVWIIEAGQDQPRLVTAYPVGGPAGE